MSVTGPRVHPRLVLVAHGTRSAAGGGTSRRLRDAVAAARPEHDVTLCFLDVAEPRLPDVLDDRPTVVVPALLSTGYHVQHDIPDAIGDRAATRQARHLGPHSLLLDAMLDRLPAGAAGTTVLVGAGSSRPEARVELEAMAALAGARLGGPVATLTLADDLVAAFAQLDHPVRVLTYLLADGQFVSTLNAAATGEVTVGAPIGVHPALVELIWARYDEVSADGGGRVVG
ncbi:sirohydrochlorin chelatase [uncultured Jatrophihabitans sp.]|uniref:sirohydrochlorin chelatase n=1 Tax=uncultured Jatrophihabitans sp. TaxID=1610747 RepID=UPI0035CA8072